MIRKLHSGIGLLKLLFYKSMYGKSLDWSGIPRLDDGAKLRVRKNSKISLSNKSYFDTGTLIRVTDNAEFRIGKNSGFGAYCVVTCQEKIIIGDNVIIGPFVTIHDHDHIYKTKENFKTSGYVTAPIIIEDNVWIGGNVIILKGVRIGTGSVVAAGTVVTKDIPAHSIVFNSKQTIVKDIIYE